MATETALVWVVMLADFPLVPHEMTGVGIAHSTLVTSVYLILVALLYVKSGTAQVGKVLGTMAAWDRSAGAVNALVEFAVFLVSE